MMKILLFVFAMRCLLFVASYVNIPIEIVAVLRISRLAYVEMVSFTDESSGHLEEDTLAYSNFCVLHVRDYLWLA